jgi:phage shock protein PspC (stress-responsive transcriptional regulator)
MRKFCRSKSDKKIWGVCSGLAKYTDTDVAFWRIGFLVGICTTIPTILLYCIITIVTKSE